MIQDTTGNDTRITIGELISELKATRAQFDWRLVGRAKQLRGFSKSGTAMSFDPIRALCFVKTGQIFDDNSWLQAGAAIGLASDDCADIIDASNNLLHEAKQAAADPYKEWLRRQLLFSVKLNPAATSNSSWLSMLTNSLHFA